MAYASGKGVTSLGGLVGLAIGAYCGYNEAASVSNDMSPIMGAGILGLVGFVVGSAGAFVLRSLSQFLIYLVLIGILAFVFRDQVEAMTGIDPVSAFLDGFERVGINLPGNVQDLEGRTPPAP